MTNNLDDLPNMDALVENVGVVKSRGGKLPKFYRNEVDRIRGDTRPIAVIAEAWGVSFDTIQRVCQAGRFIGVPYIARDEVFLTPEGNYTSARQFHVAVGKAPKRGRPFKTGRREPLTEQEQKLVLTDLRPSAELAIELRVSAKYISTFRRMNGVITRHTRPLDHITIDRIKADTRSHVEIAAAHSLPLILVQHLKGHVDEKANDDRAGDAQEAA